MKYFGTMTDNKDLVNKQYVDTMITNTTNTIDDKIDVINQNISEEYNPNYTYALGSFCLYGGRLYKCISPITTAEAWNPNHWNNTEIGIELEELVSSGEIVIGVCNTGSSTMSKVVTMSNFTLESGKIFGVVFTYSNTADFIQLNVNGTGAKDVVDDTYVFGNFAWGANQVILFTYDGTYYRPVHSFFDYRMAHEIGVAQQNIASYFVRRGTYHKGDYVINEEDGVLYYCTNDVSGQSQIDSSHWIERKVTNDIKSLFEEARRIPIPDPPTTNGTYTLSVTINNGQATYSWV